VIVRAFTEAPFDSYRGREGGSYSAQCAPPGDACEITHAGRRTACARHMPPLSRSTPETKRPAPFCRRCPATATPQHRSHARLTRSSEQRRAEASPAAVFSSAAQPASMPGAPSVFQRPRQRHVLPPRREEGEGDLVQQVHAARAATGYGGGGHWRRGRRCSAVPATARTMAAAQIAGRGIASARECSVVAGIF